MPGSKIIQDCMSKNGDLSRDAEKLFDLEKKSVKFRAELGIKTLLMLKENKDVLTALASDVKEISSHLERVSNKQEELGSQVVDLGSGLNDLEQEMSKLSKKGETTDENLHQMRLLEERVAGKIDSLSEEFIDRWVKSPLIKDLGVIYNRLRDLSNEGNSGNSEILEQFKIILENHSAEIIEPKRGEVFNPREQQAIKKIEATAKDMDGRISETCKIGR
ncbi:MAG: hypothetical protein QG610_804, partial [Euryarchaeota archaeon]|nr:hypothetical protein [Euryarchaeota archaeon]